ncbi:hypothetical protein C8F04DRAFT_1404377, partial [Mycena alexandri]
MPSAGSWRLEREESLTARMDEMGRAPSATGSALTACAHSGRRQAGGAGVYAEGGAEHAPQRLPRAWAWVALGYACGRALRSKNVDVGAHLIARVHGSSAPFHPHRAPSRPTPPLLALNASKNSGTRFGCSGAFPSHLHTFSADAAEQAPVRVRERRVLRGMELFPPSLPRVPAPVPAPSCVGTAILGRNTHLGLAPFFAYAHDGRVLHLYVDRGWRLFSIYGAAETGDRGWGSGPVVHARGGHVHT